MWVKLDKIMGVTSLCLIKDLLRVLVLTPEFNGLQIRGFLLVLVMETEARILSILLFKPLLLNPRHRARPFHYN